MSLKRVVVTGLGALTPIGNTVDEYWEGLANGKSGAAPITRFDASKFKTKFVQSVLIHLYKEIRSQIKCAIVLLFLFYRAP